MKKQGFLNKLLRCTSILYVRGVVYGESAAYSSPGTPIRVAAAQWGWRT